MIVDSYTVESDDISRYIGDVEEGNTECEEQSGLSEVPNEDEADIEW
jgi:hypothetical protein